MGRDALNDLLGSADNLLTLVGSNQVGPYVYPTYRFQVPRGRWASG